MARTYSFFSMANSAQNYFSPSSWWPRINNAELYYQPKFKTTQISIYHIISFYELLSSPTPEWVNISVKCALYDMH